MKKLLKWGGIVSGALVVLILAAGFMSPSEWVVERSIVIDAEPREVHAFVGDFARWPDWSPFEDQDPEMVMTLEEQTSGVGAKRTWVSPDMGDGEQWITESDPDTGVSMKLAVEGMALDIRFTYAKVDGGTKVTWKDWGDFGSNPFYRLMGTQMESLMGPEFERGLQKLKAQVEAAPDAPAEPTEPAEPEGESD